MKSLFCQISKWLPGAGSKKRSTRDYKYKKCIYRGGEHFPLLRMRIGGRSDSNFIALSGGDLLPGTSFGLVWESSSSFNAMYRCPRQLLTATVPHLEVHQNVSRIGQLHRSEGRA
ncbi:uncharacterized protein LOC134225274 [Armigeres subalbatus]|uniref:uncharacterized protein LOC134225274 n=1 Tax=Armigeres subalbatus TaxID=124917 RepID=UPI002ED0C060